MPQLPLIQESDQHSTETNLVSNDPIVCYCYRVRASQIRQAYEECGSLDAATAKTRAGYGCKGCRVTLASMFNDYSLFNDTQATTRNCVFAGTSMMKGLIIANGDIESRVISCNATAPQLDHCDLSGDVQYLLLDETGNPVLERTVHVPTNGTFLFDTKNEDLPRPFYGQMIFVLNRKNRAAARMNVQWYTSHGITSTHENGDTGRPRTVLPFVIEDSPLTKMNDVYLALVNPHDRAIPYALKLQTLAGQEVVRGEGTMGPYTTFWLNASESLWNDALQSLSGERFSLEMESGGLARNSALTLYFFLHNRRTNTWTSQHL